MKDLYLMCLLILVTTCLYAQNNNLKLFKRDTINLRGYIYYSNGKPVKQLAIESTQYDVEYNYFKASARVDTNGYFVLKGAKLNDTLTLSTSIFYDTPKYYNRDSRYIIIYLPSQKVLDLNPKDPVKVETKRIQPKIIPKFKPIVFEGNVDYFDLTSLPHFKKGNEVFLKYIKSQLKYPEAAIINNVEGTVQISFTIEHDGSIVHLKILRGVGYGCDEQVINALKKAPHWMPGIENGRPVAMQAIVTVQFKLTDK